MKALRQWPMWCVAGVGFTVAALSGCQTHTAGMTLPSPRYLEHPGQYTPPSPAFPLSRELARQEEAANAPVAGVAPAPKPLPQQVP
jgi:hypothetical protein